jgi:hypothetical protein
MKIGLISFLIILAASLYGQVIPEPGSNLIHTQVMFEYPAVKGADKYQVVICKWDSLKKVPVPYFNQFDNTTATLVSNLEFGFEYSWTYQALDKKQNTIFTSGPYTFYIKKPERPNLDYQRERIIPINSGEPLEGLIGQDYAKTFYDRKGVPVCYIPETPPLLNTRFSIRDLRMTPGGTITLLTKFDAVELDLNGHIIWQAPNDGKVSGESIETYHHCFSKMKNGNYMVLGNKHRLLKSPFDTIHAEVEFGTIMEYEPSGKLVWKWDSQDYFDTRDLFKHDPADTAYYYVIPHSNSYDVSEDGKYVFVGFRRISRIVQIDKVSGEVVASFGSKMVSGEAKYANDFFRFQHSSNVLKDGNLVVLNNDSIDDPNITSSIVIFTVPDSKNPTSRLLWKFDFKFDTLTDGKSFKTGNVLELPDKNLLVNMGTLNRTIEVTRDKKVVWDSFTEKWDPKLNRWEPFPQFRSCYISSLYPCYFTANITRNSIRKGQNGNATLTIYNEGTETDNYEIIFDGRNKSIKSSTNQVQPGKSATLDIPMVYDELSRIRIVSSLDHRRYRIINFPDENQESTLNSLPEITINSSPDPNVPRPRK